MSEQMSNFGTDTLGESLSAELFADNIPLRTFVSCLRWQFLLSEKENEVYDEKAKAEKALEEKVVQIAGDANHKAVEEEQRGVIPEPNRGGVNGYRCGYPSPCTTTETILLQGTKSPWSMRPSIKQPLSRYRRSPYVSSEATTRMLRRTCRWVQFFLLGYFMIIGLYQSSDAGPLQRDGLRQRGRWCMETRLGGHLWPGESGRAENARGFRHTPLSLWSWWVDWEADGMTLFLAENSAIFV